ncbi:MAG: ABC transporter ATP-binding protein [Caulobacterales bacterium]|uniref:ABC transporter ATP-binding protein n=1 Tax=Glycocaulis sp. TaxID=1969725 RepID=UPI003FA06797
MSIIARNMTLDLPVYNIGARSFRGALLPMSVGGNVRAGGKGPISVRALSDVSFEIHDGDRVALFGHNGAGKSTLLRTLAGIYELTSGELHVEGQISTLFDITLGMDEEATGLENIELLGLSRGFSLKHIREARDEIIEFAELGAFIEMPVKTYSSGMKMRLAFSVATSFQPDVLLLDEWVAAGDATFMRKTEERLAQRMENTRIVVFASHSVPLLKRFCTRAIVLNHGTVSFCGTWAEFEDAHRAL